MTFLRFVDIWTRNDRLDLGDDLYWWFYVAFDNVDDVYFSVNLYILFVIGFQR